MEPQQIDPLMCEQPSSPDATDETPEVNGVVPHEEEPEVLDWVRGASEGSVTLVVRYVFLGEAQALPYPLEDEEEPEE